MHCVYEDAVIACLFDLLSFPSSPFFSLVPVLFPLLPHVMFLSVMLHERAGAGMVKTRTGKLLSLTLAAAVYLPRNSPFITLLSSPSFFYTSFLYDLSTR
jgi:hypothetical protein